MWWTAGDGPPVVHLHGTNTSSLSHLMLPGRTPGTRSYLVDRPGCGLSDPDSFRPGDFREYAVGFVGDVLDALGLDAAHLVGASGGGIWATWYALAHPERVRGLVMLGSVPTLPGGRAPLPLRLAATPGVGDLMVRAVKPGRRMLLKMMASVGEAETIVRHPDLLDSLVAGARDPVASPGQPGRAAGADLPTRLPTQHADQPRRPSPAGGAHPHDLGRSRSRRTPGASARASRPRSPTPASRYCPPGTCPSWATRIGWPHCWRSSSWRPDQANRQAAKGRAPG